MVKMAALAPKGVFEEEDFMYPLGKSPRTSGISTIIRATATKQHKHTAPRTCWHGRRFPFKYSEAAGRTRERQYVADVGDARQIHDQALEARAEARVLQH